MNMNLKRGRSDEQDQPKFKKRAPNEDSSSASKAYEEKCGGSQFFKTLCATCRKRHHEKCLVRSSGCYGCGQSNHQVRNCLTLTARGREANQASYVDPDVDAPKKNCFYLLQANKDK
uniref:CCHC-type domain-containing protein n=1 Tax=Solanum tuberosum TaxID=4113 RepID=M1DC04_SOLTU